MSGTATARANEGIWVGLRRRKVVQWGLAYAAGAWVLLQVLGYAADAFTWPLITKQLAMLGLVVGFPVIVALAWYHGDRGQQRVTGSELAVLTLLLIVGGGLLWLYAQRSGPTATATVDAKPMPTSATTDTRPSIAVLPFENRSRLEDDAFFVDGIHDDILTQLTKVGALKVIARTSVEQFRDTKLTSREIGEKLGVSKILEGGVQRAGDRVHVTVQLIDAGTDAHVWAESYDRELSAANIFAIQGEVATAIAGALKTSLTAGEQVRVNAIPTESLEAWQAYQLGRQRMATRTSATLGEAEVHFRKAIALDPRFALAWTGLADALLQQTDYAGRSKDAGLDEAEKFVARALELDPNLAEAWYSAGNIANNRVQAEQAEEMLRRAIALNPNFANAYAALGRPLSQLGRWEEALALAEHAVVLDPLSAGNNYWLGQARRNVGRFNEALIAYEQAIAIDPALAAAYAHIGGVHAYGRGRFDIAMAWYQKAASLDSGSPGNLASLAQGRWELGDDAAAGRWLDRVQAIGEGTAASNAVASLVYRGSEDALARKHAQKAAELDPLNTFLIRDHDLRHSDFGTARARYAKAYPQLFVEKVPELKGRVALAAISLVLVLQHTGEDERARALLDQSEAYIRTIPRLGPLGYGISDVAILALRGQTKAALAKLREAERAGWRRWWRYHRDFDPNLGSIRNEPEFKAVFADIERDMERQRARLAARPKDAPLELTDAR
jgi:TolB-like protein/Tfp pilus assembly protein PilF